MILDRKERPREWLQFIPKYSGNYADYKEGKEHISMEVLPANVDNRFILDGMNAGGNLVKAMAASTAIFERAGDGDVIQGLAAHIRSVSGVKIKGEDGTVRNATALEFCELAPRELMSEVMAFSIESGTASATMGKS